MSQQSARSNGRERFVLDGVSRVGYYHDMQQHEDSKARCPEDVCFPSVVRACLEYLGDGLGCRQVGVWNQDWRLGCTYAYLMGTTGAAFRLNWRPGWHGDNVATFLVSDDPSEIFHRGFASVGYGCEIVCKSQVGQDAESRLRSEPLFRRKIVESLRDKGRPVIAHGIIGPPEECIVSGYDEWGDVLLGWSFFQNSPDCNAGVEFEPNGMFRKRDWFKDTWSLVLIGDRTERLDLGKVYRDALEWALQVVRAPLRYGDRRNGLAAYNAWAEHLLRDEEFATDDVAVLGERFMVHDDAVGTVAEGRWYASVFLTEAVHRLPGSMAEHLLAAAACYAAEHDLMWKAWGTVGGLGRDEAKVRKLAQPEVRRQLVPVIRAARDKDAEAANLIEKALSVWRGEA